ncbi:MAG: TIGR01777 family protein [Planctomycetes bacterium]|nr:TIGR01777 family protein [Planctomycetota bacterium]
MKVLVSGSTGLVGAEVVSGLARNGHPIIRLVRARSSAEDSSVFWDPAGGMLDAASLEGLDGVVHLAGENVSTGRWTQEKKARIRDSRVKGTRLLCEALARLARPPKVAVCASAIGFYGSRGDEVVQEASTSGSGFLAEVCKDWEAATQPAVERGIRVVNLRIGVVLSPLGGALSKMLFPFRMGMGGVIGNGRQWLSWIDLEDLAEAVRHVLTAEAVWGPVNAVSPNPATNREFTKTLGRVLSRPTVFPMPSFAARLAFGEMADELLLSSTRVEPRRLIESGFEFRHPTLEGSLRHQLDKPMGH